MTDIVPTAADHARAIEFLGAVGAEDWSLDWLIANAIAMERVRHTAPAASGQLVEALEEIASIQSVMPATAMRGIARAALEASRTPAPTDDDTTRAFTLSWVAGARPPTHPAAMYGVQVFQSFDDAVRFMVKQADDATFVSLIERVIHKTDRTDDAIAALQKTGRQA